MQRNGKSPTPHSVSPPYFSETDSAEKSSRARGGGATLKGSACSNGCMVHIGGGKEGLEMNVRCPFSVIVLTLLSSIAALYIFINSPNLTSCDLFPGLIMSNEQVHPPNLEESKRLPLSVREQLQNTMRSKGVLLGMGRKNVEFDSQVQESEEFTKGVTNVRLCSESSFPFIQGTIYVGSDMARITVFDAELLQGVKLDGFEEGADSSSPPMISFLAFIEDDGSIEYSYTKGWGTAHQSSLAVDSRLRLRCDIWFGHNRTEQMTAPPLHSSPATIVSKVYINQNTMSVIRCPLPLSPHRIYSFSKFQVRLSMESSVEDILLYLPTLPLCHARPPSLTMPDKHEGKSSKGNPLASLSSPPSTSQIGLCVRPFHRHSIFTDIKNFQKGRSTHSDGRVTEFLDYNFFLGVDKVFFYDRFVDQGLKFTKRYEERGLLDVIPFPTWSEVYYRRKTFNKPSSLYCFPLIYDQLVHFEHCFMEGRRNNVGWTLLIDTDEFFRPENLPIEGGVLAKYLQAREEEYIKEKGEDAKPLKGIRVNRIQFIDGRSSSPTLLSTSTKRCRHIMEHTDHNGISPQTKVIAHAQRSLNNIIAVHTMEPSSNEILEATKAEAIIHHYYSAPKHDPGKSHEMLCHEERDPFKKDEDSEVEDLTLVPVAEMLHVCGLDADCKENEACGNFCQLRS